jgi:hypothetical protein
MPVERRGWVIAFEIGSTGNGRNPIFNGRRQPSCGGTSRMTRECQVRICERLGVKFPGPTRPKRSTPIRQECPQTGESCHAAVKQRILVSELGSKRWNKPQGSELVQCRVECTPHAPNPSPIRRIIDDSIGLTGALAVMVGAIFRWSHANGTISALAPRWHLRR